jgi:hypothetical protein
VTGFPEFPNNQTLPNHPSALPFWILSPTKMRFGTFSNTGEILLLLVQMV